MADEKQQMCLACSTKPAVTGGPVPLCAACAALAEKNKRGVKFVKETEKEPEPTPRHA